MATVIHCHYSRDWLAPLAPIAKKSSDAELKQQLRITFIFE